MSFFFSFLSFSFKLRERVYKIGYKEKWSLGYLPYFFDGVPWRIFLLLRANRLYAIFNTGLKNLGPSCPRYFFVFFTRSTGFWSVCHEPCPITNFFLFYFRWREGVPHFRFRVPANRLTSTFQCQATRVRSPSINIWSPLWPIFFLNGHSLTACYC